jgi:hypothetical protein
MSPSFNYVNHHAARREDTRVSAPANATLTGDCKCTSGEGSAIAELNVSFGWSARPMQWRIRDASEHSEQARHSPVFICFCLVTYFCPRHTPPHTVDGRTDRSPSPSRAKAMAFEMEGSFDSQVGQEGWKAYFPPQAASPVVGCDVVRYRCTE